MTQEIRFKRFVRTLLYAHCAVLVTLVFLFHPGINGYKRAMFADMVNGTAFRPHVYRVLVPYTTRFVSSEIPDVVKASLRSSIKDTRLASKLGWDEASIPAYSTVTLLIFLCFYSFAFVFRRLTLHFYPGMPVVADFAPALSLLAIPSLFRYYNHVYDPATLLFFACALLFLARRTLVPYYLIFLLAVTNKETAILLLPLFAFVFWNTFSRSKLAFHIGMQLLVFALIRTAIVLAYAGNPGELIEFHLVGNLTLFEKPSGILYIASMYSIGGYLVGKNWRAKPELLRLGLFSILGPLVLLSLFFGNLDEPRQYYEALPIVLLLSIKTIIDAWNTNSPQTAGQST